jgi:hypothetical protein
MENKMGKPGTLSAQDFTALKVLVSSHGAETLAKKVAKACNNKSKALSHEFANSAVAKAYAATAKRVVDALPGNAVAITSSAFGSIGQMVGTYGPELVIQKIAKIVKKTDAATSRKLAGIFSSS